MAESDMHVAVMNCRRMMTLLASSSEFECPTDTVACALKPEHLGGCSQSVQSGVAPDCSGSTCCCSLGYGKLVSTSSSCDAGHISKLNTYMYIFIRVHTYMYIYIYIYM